MAELLIALSILGVIATFTIPKVLQSMQDATYKSVAKEAAGAMTTAYDAYRRNNTVTSSFSTPMLLPYLNYVQMQTSGSIDAEQSFTTYSCSSSSPCLHLHNGAVLYLQNVSMSGTGPTNAIEFFVDPDGKVTAGGAAGTAGKSVNFFLYTTGQLRTWGTIEPNTIDSANTYAAPFPAADPPWFSWN